MLDFATMSYWRKFLVVALLILSLPVQSFAAVSMKCVESHADAGGTVLRHVEAPPSNAMPGVHDEEHAALAPSSPHSHDSHAGHHAHSCFACASCCVGAGLPAQPLTTAPLDLSSVSLPAAASAGPVSFVTGGIERPPRSFLV